MKNKTRVVAIGATGHFGGRICRRLLDESDLLLIVTSRSVERAEAFAAKLEQSHNSADIAAAQLDTHSEHFATDLERLQADIVIHSAGPYQGQNYRVAEACVQVGSHYLDLADGREFVQHFETLHAAAIEKDVLLVTGASTLPGLSTAVVDAFRSQFVELHGIKISISPAHQTPLGRGTVAAVLSYCGKPFEVLQNGQWVRRFGWQDIKAQRHPSLGFRLSAACDVPDLVMLPGYVPGTTSVSFHASLESKTEHIALWLMSFMTRLQLVRSWLPLTSFFQWLRRSFRRFGSATGGMHLQLTGVDHSRKTKCIDWYLTARQNHGPEVPCTPALVLARKLIRGDIVERGAMACMGLISLAEFDHEARNFNIEWTIDE